MPELLMAGMALFLFLLCLAAFSACIEFRENRHLAYVEKLARIKERDAAASKQWAANVEEYRRVLDRREPEPEKEKAAPATAKVVKWDEGEWEAKRQTAVKRAYDRWEKEQCRAPHWSGEYPSHYQGD